MFNRSPSLLNLNSRCSLAFLRLSTTPSSQQSTLGKIVAMLPIPLLLQQKKRWTGMLHGIIQNNSGSPFIVNAPPVMPTYLREVLGDVQDIIEDAAQKDSYIAKTHKRLSTRLGFNVCADAFFHPCVSNTHLEIRFSSNELFSQGPLPNSPVAHRSSRGSSCDLCALPFVTPPFLEILIHGAR